MHDDGTRSDPLTAALAELLIATVRAKRAREQQEQKAEQSKSVTMTNLAPVGSAQS